MTEGISVKLAIRTDTGAGVVRAYFASIDGKEKTELGTISIAVLDGKDGPLFRRWMSVMRDAMASVIESVAGTTVHEWSGDINPDDLETEPQA